MGAKAHCTSFFNGNVQVRSGEHVWNLVAFTSINGDSCRHQLASLQSDRPTWDSGTRHTEIRTPKCPAYPWTMETEGGICRPLNPDMVRLLWLTRSEQIINYCANKSPLTIQSSSDTRPPAIRVPRELPEFLRKPLHLYPTMPPGHHSWHLGSGLGPSWFGCSARHAHNPTGVPTKGLPPCTSRHLVGSPAHLSQVAGATEEWHGKSQAAQEQSSTFVYTIKCQYWYLNIQMDSDGYIDIQMDYGFRWITYYVYIYIIYIYIIYI